MLYKNSLSIRINVILLIASVTTYVMSLIKNPGLSPVHPRLLLAVAWLQRRAAVIIVLLCFILALVLRLYRLGVQSLWLDEGSTWAEVTSKDWLTLVGELWSRDAAYPLYHLLLKAWISLAGDSEWSLRLPSALAGVGLVGVVYLAACELCKDYIPQKCRLLTTTAPPFACPIIAALLLTTAPFAIWHAQDAKVYSLLMLVTALLIWAFLRALRLFTIRSWLLVVSLAIVSVFVHRLALLEVAGVGVAYVIVWPHHRRTRLPEIRPEIPNADGLSSVTRLIALKGRWVMALFTGVIAAVGVVGAILVVRHESQVAGGHIQAGPLLGSWLTFTYFCVDRGDIADLGVPLVIWVLPYAALTLWGLVQLARDARNRQPFAIVILCSFVVPLALFATTLAFAPIYEARYATVALPGWILILAYPFRELQADHPRIRSLFLGSRYLMLVAILIINALVLFQPNHGIFSGAPVKEQWREAITDVARRVHPDDLLILHPYYVQPLWDYYAPRVTPDRLPEPVVFGSFAEGFRKDSREFVKRTYDEDFNKAAFGKKRELLLIAPEHARVVDPPDLSKGDRYGWLGLRFQYPQNTWPCGGTGDAYIGVEVMCQSFPDTYNASGPGTVPQPTIPIDATFGGELHLRGYSLDLFQGRARPGGTLPVTLYWEASKKPTHDYAMFLHLCRDCDLPPVANDNNSMPLNGYPPAGRTTTWRVGDPVHDERALYLPPDLPPGRYTLLLGVYPVDNPVISARLPIASPYNRKFDHTRLVLGEIEIAP